jgi:hypothetical protein
LRWRSVLGRSPPHGPRQAPHKRHPRSRSTQGLLGLRRGRPGRPRRPRTAGVRLQQRLEQFAVMGVRRGQHGVQREPVRIAQDVVLRSGFCPGQWGSGRLARPPFRPHRHPVDAGSRPLQQPRVGELVEHELCSWSQTPASCHSRSRRHAVCPDPQPSSSGRSRQRQPVSSEQDPFERGSVVDPRASARAARCRPRRDQRLDQFPEPVRDQPLLLASRHDRG